MTPDELATEIALWIRDNDRMLISAAAIRVIAGCIREAVSEQPLTDREIMLLGKLWALAWTMGPRGYEHFCLICDRCGPDKATVQHAIGCAFHGLDERELTAISADWTPA